MASYALPLLALVVGLFTATYDLGSYPLLQPDEGRNAEIAREMLESQSWLVPTYNGFPYLDKPAFYFRAVAISLGIFGETEAAARLISALSGLGLLALIFGFCRRHYDTRTAATAVLVIATSPLFIAFSRIVIFDMTLAFFVSAAILACFDASIADTRPERAKLYSWAAGCIGLATLVKGPIGFVLPTLVMAVYNFLERHRGWWRDAFTWRNLAIFFALFLPWFVGVSLHQPDFPYYGIVKETLQRFTSNEFHRAGPVYYYLVIIALCFFPWSVLLPESMVAAWRERGRWTRPDRLFAVWAVVVVGFFTLSQSKLPGYILTAIIALGVLIGRLFVQAARATDESHSFRVVRRGSLLLAVTTSLAAGLVAVPVLDTTALSRLPPKTAAHLGHLTPVFQPLAGLLAATAIIALFGFWRRDARHAFAAFLIFPLALVLIATQYIQPYVENRSAKALAQVMPALDQNTVLACYMCFPNGLPFYLKRFITVVSFKDGRELESNYVRFRLLDAPNWPETVVREKDFRAWLDAGGRPVYLLARTRDVQKVRELLAGQAVDFTSLSSDYWGTWLLPAGRN